jgi:hypothetical protein
MSPERAYDPPVRLVLLAVATVLVAAVPAPGVAGRLTAAKAERIVERKASIRYDGAVVHADCRRAGRGYSCRYVATADGCRVGAGTATVAARGGRGVRVSLREAFSAFCDSG